MPISNPNQAAVKIQEYWNEHLPEVEQLFYGFPPLRPYLYRCITGKEPPGPLPRDWVERWIVQEVLDQVPVDRCVSLCSGFGAVERTLARLGAFRECLGLDIAPQAVAAAQEAAHKEALFSIKYQQADLNELELEPNSVDLVWATGAFHHLDNLEHVTTEVHRALRPGGFLIANEYIGPKHQQVGPRQRELINAAIYIIPRRLRGFDRSTYVPTRFRRPRWRRAIYQLRGMPLNVHLDWPRWKTVLAHANNIYAHFVKRRNSSGFQQLWDLDPWFFENIDPSEGVRSDEIIPILIKVFGSIEVRHYNGSILLHVLHPEFYKNFDASREEDSILLQLLTTMEDALIRMHSIQSDHAVLIARKTQDSSSGDKANLSAYVR